MKREHLIYFLIGLLCGLIIALLLTNNEPDPRPDKAASASKPQREGANISDADFRREGQGA